MCPYNQHFITSRTISSFSSLCFYQDMEDKGGGVIATEKYGSQEAWRYEIKDGVMQRERTGQERATRGKSIADAFKVLSPLI